MEITKGQELQGIFVLLMNFTKFLMLKMQENCFWVKMGKAQTT